MEFSQEEKLNLLGISVWKKRSHENSLNLIESHLIEDKYLFCSYSSDNLMDESSKMIFFKTLALSIGEENVSKVLDLDSTLNIKKIILMDTELPPYLSKYDDSSIFKHSSMEEICSSTDNKKEFLDLIKKLVN